MCCMIIILCVQVKLNQYVSKFGVGVYHSGVEVYSRGVLLQ